MDCTSVLCLTSQRQCCGCPAEWSPRGQTAWPLPARHWAASPPEDPNWRRCCCRRPRFPGQVKVLWEMRRRGSHRTPAACRGRPPSPLRWSLRGMWKRREEKNEVNVIEQEKDWRTQIWKKKITCKEKSKEMMNDAKRLQISQIDREKVKTI